jgi:AcrR family transcriptional regulator
MADTASHVEPKAVEILDSIKSVFAEKGFDGASMQDLARAAGMSAGNFYRYFPSKNAIIETMVSRDLAEVEERFAEIRRAPDPREALLTSIAGRIRHKQAHEGPLWAEIQAAARRRPEIAGIMCRMEAGVTGKLIDAFSLISGIAPNEAARRFVPHAVLIVLLVKGATIGACNPALLRPDGGDEEMLALVIRTIGRILDDIADVGRETGDLA